MPFLDGVPCSIHGYVLPDGTAVFRPVEIVSLRDVERRQFVYAGLGTYWDPPDADREQMRAAARRVGDHLAAAHGYRGAFGIDGVLTADGFRPTELNARMSGGAAVVCDVDRRFFTLLQAALVSGDDVGLTAADLETVVPLMDAERVGRVAAIGQGSPSAARSAIPSPTTVDWMERSEVETGNTLFAGDTPNGFFAKVDPCAALRRGERLAGINLALAELLDRDHGASFGKLEAGADVRRPALGLPPMARVVVVGGGFGGMAAAARLAKLGHDVTLLERSPRLGGAMSPVSENGFTWDAGPTSTAGARRRPRPLPQVGPAARGRARSGARAARSDPRASVRGRHVGPGDRWISGGAARGLRGDGHGARSAVGRLRRLVRRRLGGAAAALLRGARGRRTPCPRRWPPGWTAARCCTSACAGPSATTGCSMVAAHPFVAEGHDLRNVPAWNGLRAYLEQSFGAWRVPASAGGMAGLTAALEARLATRGVDRRQRRRGPRPGRPRRPGRRGGDAAGDDAADVVVCAIDPRRLPALAAYVDRTMPAIPPVIATSASRARCRTCRPSWCCTATRRW